ncbi:hypothetical protein E8E11_006679 [Didymella keratinophila]|nr:hypothetical protein E8E11_006679 [Didymella keratinophila]
MAAQPPQDVEEHIKALYHTYRHTTSPASKGLFCSPTCLQICRPVPSYSARCRAQIVQYLQDAERGKVPLKSNDVDSESDEIKESPVASKDLSHDAETAYYTIRPLQPSEHIFGSELATSAIGHTPATLKMKAEAEGWIGMRVDMWDEV